MDKVRLGNTDLLVSKVCLGCMGFGNPTQGQHTWTLPKDESIEVLKYALERGINFFDTAIAYQSGTSEQYVGEAIRKYANREDIVVATKFLPRTKDEIDNGITGQQHIHNMVNKSLENLGLDYIDLYIYHMWDYNTPIEDILEGLNDVVNEGKVRYIGISNVFKEQLEMANNIAEKMGYPKFVSVQNHYNLIFREEEKEMCQYCNEKNIAMTPYSSLAAGRLSRLPEESSKRLVEDSYAKLKYDSTQDIDRKIIDRVIEIANKYHVSMSEVALSWLIHKNCIPVVGATKLKHIDTACLSAYLKLSEEDMKYLEELYVTHKLVGVMAQNTASSKDDKHVWSTGNQNIK